MTKVAGLLPRNASSARHSTIKSFVPTKTLSRVFIALFHEPASSLQHYLPRTHNNNCRFVPSNERQQSWQAEPLFQDGCLSQPNNIVQQIGTGARCQERHDTVRVWRSKLISVPLRACLGDECVWGIRSACEAVLSLLSGGAGRCSSAPIPRPHHTLTFIIACMSQAAYLSHSFFHALPFIHCLIYKSIMSSRR